MQLFDLDEILGGVVDRLHYLRPHQGAGMGGIGAGGIDEGPDVQFAQHVAFHPRCLRRGAAVEKTHKGGGQPDSPTQKTSAPCLHDRPPSSCYPDNEAYFSAVTTGPS